MSGLVPLGPGDVAELARLHMACFPPDQAWSPQSFTEVLSDPTHLGWRVEVDGRSMGFILGRLIIDEAELLTLAVSSRCRRQGWGEKLIREFVKSCRDKNAIKMFLEVAETNEAALRLYAKAGFRPISRRWNYYPGGLSAHVLQLDLV